jgi:hypothetical protein
VEYWEMSSTICRPHTTSAGSSLQVGRGKPPHTRARTHVIARTTAHTA